MGELKEVYVDGVCLEHFSFFTCVYKTFASNEFYELVFFSFFLFLSFVV